MKFFTKTSPLLRIHPHENNDIENGDEADDGSAKANDFCGPRGCDLRNDPGQFRCRADCPAPGVRKTRSPLPLALARSSPRIRQDLKLFNLFSSCEEDDGFRWKNKPCAHRNPS